LRRFIELKNRAISENLSYIETQLSTIPSNINTSDLADFTQLSNIKDEKAVMTLLETLYKTSKKEMPRKML
jgi:adenosine deaminase/adenosine deaminase CECR1